ncbi:MAG: asparagine synthase (glutamine-hydrolyzing) [Chitinophagaceae bacterium]|nr:asparagine synthase (glutamine-hydrolyzing) [Chitinophagaceae bacterium]
MCGIAGVFNISQKEASLEDVKKMGAAIAHRGPDGEGYFVEENVGFAHRRLAILDTSDNGAQPMHSKNGNWVIIFNGCIYNYIELKQDLLKRGHTFNSTSDTEVIAEGLAAYGISFFEKMDGMFAIAAWNKQEKTLYLTRDRYGIKPLYYWFNGEVMAFASEIKAIIQHPDFKTELNVDALNEYFTFQNVFTFQTLFKGVYMLPPANTVSINSSTTEVLHSSWWDYNFTETDTTMSFEDAVDETERLFKKAVARQMVSDVPVGSYLSGGMDSGSITAIASKYVNRLSTFTCGFDMSEVSGIEANYDERRDAELMANHFKTEHFEQVINAGDLKWSLPRVVYHLEDLKVGMSYPNYYISRLASKFVKVCLQGTGGDELYGGYPWRYYRVSQSIDQKDYFEQYYNFWQRLVPDNSKQELFTPVVISQINDLKEPRKIFERVFTFNRELKYDTAEQHINNSMYFEIKTFLPGLFLVGDKLSMANGLEERFPFMDNDLVAFAQKIPVRHKLGNFEKMMKVDENEFRDKKKLYTEYNDGKNVLRKAMMNFIPEKIINRKKQGFSAPDESWYRGENAAYVKELLLGKNIASAEFINPAYVKKIIEEHIDHKINHRLLLWSLMCFEWWCRIFLKGEKYN